MDVQSFLIYTGLLIFTFLMAELATKANKVIFAWLIIIVLSLVSGLRANSVGIDTKTYFSIFNKISNKQMDLVYGVEESFMHICYFLLKIWNDERFLFFLYAFIAHALIIFRLWEAREYSSFPWCVLCYYITLYGFSLNVLRQFVAIAIIFFGSRYLVNGRYFKFLIFVLIASAFHISSVICFLFIPIEILFFKRLDKKKRMGLTIILLMSIIAFFGLFDLLVNKYISYFNTRVSNIGFMLPFKLLFVFSTAFVFKSNQNNYLGKLDGYRYIVKSSRIYYILGISLTFLSYFFAYAGRIGAYFYIFEVIYIGMLCNLKNYGKVFKLCSVFLLGYIFYKGIMSGSNGEIPYLFFCS